MMASSSTTNDTPMHESPAAIPFNAPQIVTLSDTHDLMIKVIEQAKGPAITSGQVPALRKVTSFLVQRDVITANAPVLARLLGPNFKEGKQNVVELKEDRATSMEIWFRLLHGADMEKTYDVAIDEMWHLVSAADKYEFKILDLSNWFSKWYDRQNIDKLKPRQLLYPTWVFDHAKGFLSATKRLAYSNIGHITEENPTNLYQLRLPQRVIRKPEPVLNFNKSEADMSNVEQINAAKGRLRTVLSRDLFKPVKPLFGDEDEEEDEYGNSRYSEPPDCECMYKTVYNYFRVLYDANVWPLEEVFIKTSMNDILERLDHFSYEPQENACSRCDDDLSRDVWWARRNTGKYFDGLCLDCMTKSKTDDEDSDYWHHDKTKKWDEDCRVEHGQPTWYFSFMGRRAKRSVA